MVEINKTQYIESKIIIMKNNVSSFIFDAFTYSTVRSATIQSVKVGIVYRIAQLAILAYIIGWELYYNKGYQSFDVVSSVVTTKVKGQGYVPVNAFLEKTRNENLEYYERIFTLETKKHYRILDTADYIIPPSEYNSIFIMTNFIETQQHQGFCDEELSTKSVCTSDDDCKHLKPFMRGWNGVPSGRCINSSVVSNVKVCEIFAWCPTENDSHRNEDNIIRNVLNYTIFIRNNIEFKRFNKRERNILSNITNNHISRCLYDEVLDRHCPVFQVNYILDKAEPDPIEKYKMLMKGGVVQIEIEWNCDYDLWIKCLPTYSFRRFDLPSKKTNTSSGFNFRFSNKYKVNNTEHRLLYKAFGLRFIISVNGIAGKFNVIPFMVKIGAGFGLMGISVLIADCVMLHCTKNRKFFQKMKELDIKDGLSFVDVSNVARL